MSPSPLTVDPRLQVNGPREALAQRFSEVRAHSLALAAPLSAEDQCVQSMPDTSPTKWHLAHSSWFFEAVVLRTHVPDYVAFDERFFYLFNSYYEALGPRHPRPLRGLLTRPTLAQVHAYRAHVDAAVQNFIVASDAMVTRAAEMKDCAAANPGDKELARQADLLAAQAKFFAANAAWDAADRAVQVWGGKGWSPLYRPARHLMDSRVCRIYEGTDEILKLKIASAVLGKEWEAFK